MEVEEESDIDVCWLERGKEDEQLVTLMLLRH